MPLKGRHLHTLRFLWHANQCAIPWRILIADGQVHPTIARLLEDRAKFPNLDIEYVRYPDDRSYPDFWRKIADAISRVKSKYFMWVDNDDFLFPTGLERSVAFLDANPDFVCCGGGVAGFELHAPRNAPLPMLCGDFSVLRYRYRPPDRSFQIEAASSLTRAVEVVPATWPYYAVTRSEAAAALWPEAARIGFLDTMLHERFCMMGFMALGKGRSDASMMSYFRQYSTSIGGGYRDRLDWVDHLLHTPYSHEIDATVAVLSELVAKADDMEQSVAAEMIRKAIGDKLLRPYLRRIFRPRSTILRAKYHVTERMPEISTWLKRARFLLRRERHGIFDQLRRDGATEDYIATFRSELSEIERVLIGPEFPQFLCHEAPDLLRTAMR
jgi:glycosyltransferase domain-containing protein